jgi:sigma-B regulation protein RsbQ
MKNADRPELGEELEASFCAADPEIARQFAAVTFLSDNRSDLPLVNAPALVLQCADDAVAPTEVGRYVHASLRGSTLVEMDATGHCPHMSHPEETIRAMREFLADGGAE